MENHMEAGALYRNIRIPEIRDTLWVVPRILKYGMCYVVDYMAASLFMETV